MCSKKLSCVWIITFINICGNPYIFSFMPYNNLLYFAAYISKTKTTVGPKPTTMSDGQVGAALQIVSKCRLFKAKRNTDNLTQKTVSFAFLADKSLPRWQFLLEGITLFPEATSMFPFTLYSYRKENEHWEKSNIALEGLVVSPKNVALLMLKNVSLLVIYGSKLF